MNFKVGSFIFKNLQNIILVQNFGFESQTDFLKILLSVIVKLVKICLIKNTLCNALKQVFHEVVHTRVMT